jgi:hypothetical protein
MALILQLKPTKPKKKREGTEKTKVDFRKWYNLNKHRLSVKKAARYKEDAAYREAIKARTRANREALRASKMQEIAETSLDKTSEPCNTINS